MSMFLKDLLGNQYKEGMTEEEISAALENVHQSRDADMNKLKKQLSDANSEAAKYKRQMREKQTEEEAAASARQEEYDKMVKEIADLKRSAALADFTANLTGIGYDAKLASETAAAMLDGDFATVIANQSKYIEAQKKLIHADLLKQTPRPSTGADNPDVNYSEQISKAQADGDFAAAAYYTRLQQTQNIVT